MPPCCETLTARGARGEKVQPGVGRDGARLRSPLRPVVLGVEGPLGCGRSSAGLSRGGGGERRLQAGARLRRGSESPQGLPCSPLLPFHPWRLTPPCPAGRYLRKGG